MVTNIRVTVRLRNRKFLKGNGVQLYIVLELTRENPKKKRAVMETSKLGLEKYVHEVYDYINELARDLGHPNEQKRVFIIWRSVMHTIRDRIHISESLDLMSSLPMILKGMYTMGWKYHEKPPLNYETIEQMKTQIKAHQNQYGEEDFDWSLPTDEIAAITIDSLSRYLSEGQMEHIKGQLPEEVKAVMPQH